MFDARGQLAVRLGETAVAGGELADTLLERGVLGGGPLNSLAGEFAFGVAGLIEQLPDGARWSADLGAAGAASTAWVRWAATLGRPQQPQAHHSIVAGHGERASAI